jgi:hypothetical protein
MAEKGAPFMIRAGRTELMASGMAIVLASVLVAPLRIQGALGQQRHRRPPYENRLDAVVEVFDSGGQTLAQNFLSLAYRYDLPMGVEYLDRAAVSEPLHLQLRGKSVREILSSLVAQVPEYRVTFSGGIVQLYSPQARGDPSNLLNAVIDDFHVSEMDPQVASAAVFEALVHKVAPTTSIVESTALGTLGPPTLTLRLNKSRVYEILDAIVARYGEAVWVVRVPPEKLSTLKGALWYIYPLEPSDWRAAVLGDVTSLFPAEPVH